MSARIRIPVLTLLSRRPNRLAPLRASLALSKAEGGATAIEFALIAPVFFLLILGILEIALLVWFSNLLHDGATQAGRYLRDETMKCVRQGDAPKPGDPWVSQKNVNCTGATSAGMRNAVCAAISRGGMKCDAARLKLAVYSADDPVATPIPSSTLIDEKTADMKKSRAYVVALGYEWGFSLPTTKMLLVNSGGRVQLQSRTYATTAERALR